MSIRDDKVATLIKNLAGQYVAREASNVSFITITRVTFNPKNNRADILFTAIPEEREEAALDFLKRKRSDFKDYVKDNAKLRSIPHFDFTIDEGEKNRQRIDEISRNT